MESRRLLITLQDLNAGGAERVVLTLLRHLSRDRLKIDLALVRCEGRFLADVPSDVPIHDLGAGRVRSAGRPLIRLVRRLRPHVVLSTLFFMNHYLLLLRPLLPRGTKLVVREGITVSSALRTWRRPWLWALLYRTIYRSADRIICQSESMKEYLASRFAIPRSRMVTVYNPLDLEEIRARAVAVPNPFAGKGVGPHLVAAGRLSRQKGFDILIRALPALHRLHPKAELWILGEERTANGTVKRQLEEICESQGVRDKVHFTGHQDNPYAFFKHADLFVLSSRYEGLPNVLLEALGCGCPVVALDAPGGTREIMQLTGQMDRLTSALDWKPEWFRKRSAGEALPDLSTFSVERATRTYEDILAHV
jgi:glycosyltransferase involved in cell wall biosynthesis